jgi:lipopolysaccharide export LptBFGC system permease protein LptF
VETRETLGYLLGLAGIILVFYWYQNSGLNLKHVTSAPFINAYFLIGIPLLAIALYLIMSTRRQNT